MGSECFLFVNSYVNNQIGNSLHHQSLFRLFHPLRRFYSSELFSHLVTENQNSTWSPFAFQYHFRYSSGNLQQNGSYAVWVCSVKHPCVPMVYHNRLFVRFWPAAYESNHGLNYFAFSVVGDVNQRRRISMIIRERTTKLVCYLETSLPVIFGNCPVQDRQYLKASL